MHPDYLIHDNRTDLLLAKEEYKSRHYTNVILHQVRYLPPHSKCRHLACVCTKWQATLVSCDKLHVTTLKFYLNFYCSDGHCNLFLGCKITSIQKMPRMKWTNDVLSPFSHNFHEHLNKKFVDIAVRIFSKTV